MILKQSKQVIKFKESEIRKDKYNKQYKIITFQSESYVFSKSLIYENHIIFYDKIGTKYLGDIVKKKVQEYQFKDIFDNDIKVNNFKALVLGDTTFNTFEDKVFKVFQEKGHEIVKETNGIISIKKECLENKDIL